MTGAEWGGVIAALLTIAAAVAKWWLGPKYSSWRDRRERDKAHKANAKMDAKHIADFIIRRRRRK